MVLNTATTASNTMRTTSKILIALLVMAISQSCISYKFNGAALDYNKYKTVSFGNIPIRAALVYPPLQQLFQNKLQDVVTQQTRLRQIDNPNSDLRFEGEITNYNLSPQAVGENAYATRTRLTISVRIRYIPYRRTLPTLILDRNSLGISVFILAYSTTSKSLMIKT